MTATADFRQVAQYIGLAICALIMRTALWVFGILWGIVREIVNGMFRVAIGIIVAIFSTIAFCEEVKAQGYKPGVYASTLWYRKRIDLNRLKKYTIWNAHYGVASSPIDCALWQGTCTARLPGYKGDMDVNISYIG